MLIPYIAERKKQRNGKRAKRLNCPFDKKDQGGLPQMSKLFKAITVLVTLVLAGGAMYKI